MTSSANALIYKIVSSADWARAAADGVYRGAPVDLADGFMHFSAAHQVRETAAKHFAGQRDLVLVAVLASHLCDALRWEVSRGGDRFPHLYGPLTVSDVAWAKPLPSTADGAHDFDGLLP